MALALPLKSCRRMANLKADPGNSSRMTARLAMANPLESAMTTTKWRESKAWLCDTSRLMHACLSRSCGPWLISTGDMRIARSRALFR